MMRQALREAAVLFFFAAALGSLYTASTGKGMFADTAGVSSPLSGNHAPVLIPLDEARGFFDSGEALFIDARHEFDYKLGHIKGAMNIPLQELDERKELISAIAKDKLLIIYCDGAECNSSIELSSKLFQSGYSNVRIFFGGWREWEAAGLPIAQSQD
jgi:rhodanese-related sulfurtransferase